MRAFAHHARRHVDARRPREVVSPSETRAALKSFQRALETGDRSTSLTCSPRRSSLNEDVARLSPLKHANLNVLGRYSFRASPRWRRPAALREPATTDTDERG
ncbi:hypothetical protein [Streptosporangium sp. NPDC001681]|uniref:hypothetical protein n=1 Tax=Streptosporangium sp. NPDC001681 TaxID=3154395 RepID=UPI00332DA2ED